jgi:prophage regulatory protein
MAILRTRQVTRLTGLSRVTIWRLERLGEFPRRRQLGRNSVGWLSAEVDDWIATRPTPALVSPATSR